MSEEEKKKWEILKLGHTLRIYKNEFLPSYKERDDFHSSRIDFRNGIVLGLILGIFGNLAVQYSFPMFEGVVLGKYDNVFLGSVLILSISSLILTITLWRFHKLRQDDQKGIEAAYDAKCYYVRKIEKMEVQLEALKMNLLSIKNAENHKKQKN